ncbi:MAG: tRNA epoxyqueuosine(34) reductase QueG [Bacteroidales bacterium]
MPLTSADIIAEARRLGFDRCGVAPAADFPELRLLRRWLDRGYAGTMHYMERTANRRADVRRVLPSARSVIMAAMVYNNGQPYSTERADPSRAEIARYGWGDDYHDVMGHKLDALLQWMRSSSTEPFDARWYVDTGPVQERVYAQYAGLGWIGKNSCLINPELGSWLFLSEIIVSLALEPGEPGFDQCGDCTLCLEACPTGALVEARVLDATKCISYHTIEHKGPIPDEHRSGIGNHVYGCDICQEVCPWNMRPATSTNRAWQPRSRFDRPWLVELWRSRDAALQRALDGSAMQRAKVAGLRRNIAVAIGNSGRSEHADVFDEAATDDAESPSRDDPVVREHVEWAKRRLRR